MLQQTICKGADQHCINNCNSKKDSDLLHIYICCFNIFPEKILIRRMLFKLFGSVCSLTYQITYQMKTNDGSIIAKDTSRKHYLTITPTFLKNLSNDGKNNDENHMYNGDFVFY